MSELARLVLFLLAYPFLVAASYVCAYALALGWWLQYEKGVRG